MEEIALYVAIGFAAQMVDGAIGASVLFEFDSTMPTPFLDVCLVILGVGLLWMALAAKPRGSASPGTAASPGFFGGVRKAIGGASRSFVASLALVP